MEISERAVGSPCVSFLIARPARVARPSQVVGRRSYRRWGAARWQRGTRDEGRGTKDSSTTDLPRHDEFFFLSRTRSASRGAYPRLWTVRSTEDTTIRAARAELNAHRERGRGRFFERVERVESATGDHRNGFLVDETRAPSKSAGCRRRKRRRRRRRAP